MNNCGQCKYFGKSAHISDEFHECSWLESKDGEVNDKARAVPVDGSGYYAALRVRSDFGCVDWVEKS